MALTENAITTEQLIDELKSPEFKINGNFRKKDIVSIHQFSKEDVNIVLDLAHEFMDSNSESNLLKGKAIVEAFSEPSTRTFLSFQRAGKKLGAQVDGIQSMKFSSREKGESLRDTILTFCALGYNGIVLRDSDDASSLEAAKAADIPIFNAGAGSLEHPSQALLDIFTIKTETRKNFEDIHLAFIGDCKYGRTTHSLAQLAQIMGVKEMTFVSPDEVKMPRNIINSLSTKGVHIKETSSIDDIQNAGVWYVTRLQKERFSDQSVYERIKGTYQINAKTIKEAVLMHPLPRLDEINPEVDEYPNSAYFRQVKNGVYVRQAILALVLGDY